MVTTSAFSCRHAEMPRIGEQNGLSLADSSRPVLTSQLNKSADCLQFRDFWTFSGRRAL